jgi:DNA-directed RNA polymerase specialized sigma24 family protein
VKAAVTSVLTLSHMTASDTAAERITPDDQRAKTGGADAGAAGIRTQALARWSREWEWWRTQPSGRIAVSRWGKRHPCLAGLNTLEDVLAGCGRDRAVSEPVADERLAAVVAEARTGDRTATRLVLQRVLPALAHRAGSRARLSRQPLGAVLEDMLASAWLVIAEYPLERRPAKIAVNIIRDAEYRIYGYVPVSVRRSVLVPPEKLPERSTRVGGVAADEPEQALGQLSQVLVEAVRQGFPSADARLLGELFVFGLPVVEIARRDGVSQRWVRSRRQRALERLARHLGYTAPAAVGTAARERAS